MEQALGWEEPAQTGRWAGGQACSFLLLPGLRSPWGERLKLEQRERGQTRPGAVLWVSGPGLLVAVVGRGAVPSGQWDGALWVRPGHSSLQGPRAPGCGEEGGSLAWQWVARPSGSVRVAPSGHALPSGKRSNVRPSRPPGPAGSSAPVVPVLVREGRQRGDGLPSPCGRDPPVPSQWQTLGPGGEGHTSGSLPRPPGIPGAQACPAPHLSRARRATLVLLQLCHRNCLWPGGPCPSRTRGS